MHSTKIRRALAVAATLGLPGPPAQTAMSSYSLIDLSVGATRAGDLSRLGIDHSELAAAALASRVARIATAPGVFVLEAVDHIPPAPQAGRPALWPPGLQSVSRAAGSKADLGRQYSPAFYALDPTKPATDHLQACYHRKSGSVKRGYGPVSIT